MKRYIHTIEIMLSFASCEICLAKDYTPMWGMDYVVECDYTSNAQYIEQKKYEMLSITERRGDFLFSDDTEFQLQDTHAYWLMNSMMQMVQLVKTADDDWAWMLAMNECIGEYNTRLGRKTGSIEAVTKAIEELIDIYNAGNQPELNTATYVEMILMHYKTIYGYYGFIESIDDYDNETDKNLQLQTLYYQEFKEWFEINDAVNGIMFFYTYAAASYSALPMDLNCTFEYWSKERLAELTIEKEILRCWDWKPFDSNLKNISERRFNILIEYLRTRNQESIVEEFLWGFTDKDYDWAHERTDGKFDFDKIAEMLSCYETALERWRDVREEITSLLPEEKHDSYREITNHIHARFYNDLLELQELRF